MTYRVSYDNSRLWVLADDRPIAAYCSNELRSYVFPLLTPGGLIATQECPPDHPHHQGIWAGLSVDGVDLWNAGSFGTPRNRQELVGPLKEVTHSVDAGGATVTHQSCWVSAAGDELLREHRTVRFQAGRGATIVEWTSTFSHPDKPTVIGQTKESGLAVRVPPHWETNYGGLIRIASGATGEPACFDQDSPWLNIEGQALGTARAGLVMAPLTEQCPWFTRDYGCHVYNPARHREIRLAPGETLTWGMRVFAYDGAKSPTEIDALVAASPSG